jgi:hypothetical protein
MYIHTPDVAVFDCLRKGLGGKVLCALAGIEGAHAKIYGIGAILHRCPKGFHRARRCQQFQHKFISPISGVSLLGILSQFTVRYIIAQHYGNFQWLYQNSRKIKDLFTIVFLTFLYKN